MNRESVEQTFCEYCLIAGKRNGIYCENLNNGNRQMFTTEADAPLAYIEGDTDECSVKGSTEATEEELDIPLSERDELAFSRLLWLLSTKAGFPLTTIQAKINFSGSPEVNLEAMSREIDKYLDIKNSRYRTRLAERLKKKESTRSQGGQNAAEAALKSKPTEEQKKVRGFLELEVLEGLFITSNMHYGQRKVGNKERKGVSVELVDWLQKLVGKRHIFIEGHPDSTNVVDFLEKSIANKMYKPGKQTENLNLISQPCIFLDFSLEEEQLIASVISQLCLLIRFLRGEGENGQKQCEFWNSMDRELQEMLLYGANKNSDDIDKIVVNPDVLEIPTLQYTVYSFLNQPKNSRQARKTNQQIERPKLKNRQSEASTRRMLYLLLDAAAHDEPLSPPQKSHKTKRTYTSVRKGLNSFGGEIFNGSL